MAQAYAHSEAAGVARGGIKSAGSKEAEAGRQQAAVRIQQKDMRGRPNRRDGKEKIQRRDDAARKAESRGRIVR